MINIRFYKLLLVIIIMILISFQCLNSVETTFNKKKNNFEYRKISFVLSRNNTIDISKVSTQNEDNQKTQEQIQQILSNIKVQMNILNEQNNFTQAEEIKLTKQIITNDDNLQSIIESESTKIVMKKLYGINNKLSKVTFELQHPTMNLIEEYYIINNNLVYYKSFNYFGILNVYGANLQFELFYPDYKKKIQKPVFLNEIQNLLN